MNMDKVELILKNVIKLVTPSKKERIETENIIKRVLSVTDKIIKSLGLERTLAGSFLRDTWLANKKEFDIFILFPISYTREKLESLGIEIGKNVAKELKGSYEIAYAEHPYIKARVNSYDIDFVPCYKVKSASKIKSAVDRTPFHNQYILKNLQPQLTQEVRLLKQFCEGLGVYGSDLKTQGFSGYLCELLIVNYGLFKNLIGKVATWQPGKVFIDLEGYYSSKKINLKAQFPNQPLIVIDPVDSKRNVAASLSCKNFVKFVKACKEFISKPSVHFFWPKKEKVELKQIENEIKDRETKIIAILFEKPKVVDDILYPQLRKTAKRIKDILEEYEFKVLHYDVWSNSKCTILLELEVWKLPKIRKVIGPETFSVKHSKQFLSKYEGKRIFIEGVNWTTEITRKFVFVEEKLKDLLSYPAKKLKAKGIASYIADSMAKEFKILTSKEILKFASKNSEFGIFLKNYFSERIC